MSPLSTDGRTTECEDRARILKQNSQNNQKAKPDNQLTRQLNRKLSCSAPCPLTDKKTSLIVLTQLLGIGCPALPV